MSLRATVQPAKSAVPESKDRCQTRHSRTSGKGGVGKSTVSANLAFALANHGKNVGLLDLDFHGPTIPKMLGIEGKRAVVYGNAIEPVHVTGNLAVMSMAFLLPDTIPVIWRGPMKMSAIKQFLNQVNWGSLDYLVVDLPREQGTRH